MQDYSYWDTLLQQRVSFALFLFNSLLEGQ